MFGTQLRFPDCQGLLVRLERTIVLLHIRIGSAYVVHHAPHVWVLRPKSLHEDRLCPGAGLKRFFEFSPAPICHCDVVVAEPERWVVALKNLVHD